MRKHPLLACLGFGGALRLIGPVATHADDFVRESIPNKWIAPLIPEDFGEKLDYPAYFKELDRARLEAFSGRYKMALLTLKKVKGVDPVQVALVKASAQSALGQKDSALDALSDAKVAGDPKCQVLKARILADLCRHDQAITLLTNVLEKDQENVAARYYLGEVSERAGRMEEAKRAYAGVEPYVDKILSQEFDDAEALTLIGRGIDRWATINEEYKTRAALHNMLLEKSFGKVFLSVDREYWPAKVAAAEFHIARDDAETAEKRLKW